MKQSGIIKLWRLSGWCGVFLFWFCWNPVLPAQGTKSLFYPGVTTYSNSYSGMTGYGSAQGKKVVTPAESESVRQTSFSWRGSRIPSAPGMEEPGESTENMVELEPPVSLSGINDSLTPGYDAFSETTSSWMGTWNLSERTPKESIFQGIDLGMSYIPNVKNLNFGSYSLDGMLTLGIPLPTADSPLTVSPLFRWTQLKMPVEAHFFGDQINLYTAGLAIHYYRPMCESLLVDFNANVLYASDFNASESDNIRITGHVAGVWKMSDIARLYLGGLYNDATKNDWYPIAGIRWRPDDNFYLDAIFPTPKIAYRLKNIKDKSGDETPYWIYLRGDFNSERWTIRTKESLENPDHSLCNTGRITSRNIEFLAGVERKTGHQIDWSLEGGLVFSRNIILEVRDKWNPSYISFHPKSTGVVNFRFSY